METTKRTSEEARTYIEEAVRNWNLDEEGDMIIKLANAAEKMRTPKISPTMRKNVFEKNINALNLCMSRNLQLDTEYDNSLFQTALDFVQSELDDLMKSYVKPTPRKRTRKQ